VASLLRLALFLLLLIWGSAAAAADKRIALTFDDAPRQRGAFLTPDERTEMLISGLRSAGVLQAAFFVYPSHLANPDLAGGEARLDAYVAAGHVIANHTFTHPNLMNVSAEAYLAEIDQTELWLRGRPGYRPWFRFPFLNEGGRDKVKRDAVRAGLAARGLLNASPSADGSDWSLEALTVEATRAGRLINRDALRRLYVTSQMSGVAYHDELARMSLGRSPAHVMLLHETDLAALFIEDFVRELRRSGWTIITVDEAYADPLYAMQPDVPFASGTVTGSVAWERGVQPPYWPIWIGPATLRQLFEQRVSPPIPPAS
jgi:peptidoglycan/xylan/chitin deacetylase (PgdA/CDA1 family)